MKLHVAAFTMLLSLTGMAYAEVLERPRGDGLQGRNSQEWTSSPPPVHTRPLVESAGDAYPVLQPEPMQIQLLSGPSILPLGALLLGLGAGRLAERRADARAPAPAALDRGRRGRAPPSPGPEGTR